MGAPRPVGGREGRGGMPLFDCTVRLAGPRLRRRGGVLAQRCRRLTLHAAGLASVVFALQVPQVVVFPVVGEAQTGQRTVTGLCTEHRKRGLARQSGLRRLDRWCHSASTA